MWKTAIIILTLTACAGSPPRPVATHQFGDDKMTCAMLASEIQRTQVQIGQKKSAHDAKIGQNAVAIGLGAVLFWPALFFIDAKSDPKLEIDALLDRRDHLRNLAIGQGCYLPNEIYTNDEFLSNIQASGQQK